MTDQDTEQNTSTDQDQTITPDEFKKVKEINQRLQGKLTDIEKRYNEFTSIYKDIDPVEAKELKKKLEEAERKAAEKDPGKMEELYERKMNKIRSEYETEKQTIAQQLQALQKENKTLKVTDKVMAEIGALFQSDALKFIKREVEELCDLDEDGAIVIKDENGDPIFRNGKYITLKDFGELLAEKYPSLAKAQGSSGTKDATPGQKVNGRLKRDPESYAELQSMGQAGQEWLAQAKKTPEGLAKVNKILGTIRA